MRQPGYTLLEMLMTLAIIAIISAMVIPSHAWLFRDARQSVTSEQLLRALSMGRSEALLHASAVSLCGGAQGHCSGRWRDGQILFLDMARAGAVQSASDVLYQFDGTRGADLHWRSSLAKNFVSMSATGTTADEDGTFWYCESGAKTPAWALRINQAGRARVEYPDRQGRIGRLTC